MTEADDPLLSVLVVNIDYKLIAQRNEHEQSRKHFGGPQEPLYLPTLRIFGSTDAGQRVCAHIHGVFPHVYFRPENLYHASFDSKQRVQSLLPSLQVALEDLLRNFKSMYVKSSSNQRQSYYSKRRRIHSMEVVSKKTIYGMYLQEFQFIKVTVYDPNDIKRVASILEEGALRGISMQAYEAHIPYVMQFTTDYNIAPMGWMHIHTAKFRAPLPADPKPLLLQPPPAAQPATSNLGVPAALADAAVEGLSQSALTPPAVAGLGSLESPIFSHIKFNATKGSDLASKGRSQSIRGIPGTEGHILAPHEVLTQHQCAHFLSPTGVSGSNNGLETTGVTNDGTLVPLTATSAQSTGSSALPDLGANGSQQSSSQPVAVAAQTTAATAAPLAGTFRGRLLTQSSIPANLVWGSPSSTVGSNVETVSKVDTTGAEKAPQSGYRLVGASADQLSAAELLEVERLLQGLTDADVGLLQTDTDVDTDGTGSSDSENGERDVERHPIDTALPSLADRDSRSRPATRVVHDVEKVSVCELEIDVQAEHILNRHQSKSAFGAELWEEERLRCEAKGVAMDAAPTPPATQTRHRQPLPIEIEYQQRFASLQRKGRALRQVGVRLQSQREQCSLAVLSQFPAVETTTGMSSAAGETRSESGNTPEGVVASQWAEQRMFDAQQQVQLEESLHEIFSGADMDIAQEYAKSQIQSQHAVKDMDADDGVSSPLMEDELERYHEESQECDAIVQSTQVNPDNMHELEHSGRSSRLSASPMVLVNDAGRESDSEDIFAGLQGIAGGSSASHSNAESQEKRRSPALLRTSSDPVQVVGVAGRPPLPPGLLFATPRTSSGGGKGLTERTHLTEKGRDSPDLASRWYGPPDSPMDTADDRYLPPPSQVSPRARESPQPRLEESPLLEASPAAEGSPAMPGSFTQNPTPQDPQSAEHLSAPSSSGGNSSGAKSLTSVFRKRKRLSSGSGPTVSFALFPEPIQASPHTATTALTATAAGAAPSDKIDVSSGATGNAEDITPLAAQPVRKKARRSVSFKEAEEVIPPLLRSAPSPVLSIATTKTDAEVVIPRHPVPPTGQPSALTVQSSKPADSETLRRSPKLRAGVTGPRRSALRGMAFIALCPSFDAPRVTDLCSLSAYGLTDVVNVPAHFSNSADVANGGTGSGAGAGSGLSNNSSGGSSTPVKGSYLSDLHRIRAKSDLPPFDGGFPDSRHEQHRPVLPGRALSGGPHRQRCLVPTFLPPCPATLWRDRAAAEAQCTSNRRLAHPSQIHTPTQTPFTAIPPPAPAIGAGGKGMGGGAGADGAESGNEAGKRMTRLTVMSIEVFCCTRQDLLPNPKHDAVQAICWAVDDQIGNAEFESVRRLTGVICQLQRPLAGELYNATAAGAHGHSRSSSSLSAVITEDRELRRQQQQLLFACGLPSDTYLEIVDSETELFHLLVRRVTTVDPDFLAGYETEQKSLGYLCKRGRVLKLNMLRLLSRMQRERPSFRNGNVPSFSADGNSQQSLPEEAGAAAEGREDKTELASDMVITGRIILNVWRLMREELKLFNYTYNNVAANLLEVRVPYFTPAQLTTWFRSPQTRQHTIRYLHLLTVLNLQLLDKVDHVRRTAECARLYGIDYTSVLTRGSQYRVEASLLAKARKHNYLLLSPSRKAVASQAPMEVIPLVMEPRSQFYADPVVVLDFQSLYPSMMLAYNLCFSTIMGKMKPGAAKTDGGGAAGQANSVPGSGMDNDTTERLGTISYAETTAAQNAELHTDQTSGRATSELPSTHNRHAYVAPNGSVFCSKSVRLGVLPQMVQEMLDTRVMVKRAMKRHKTTKAPTGSNANARDVLQRVLDARQLAIKLLSNVTYGYTSAGYSGRMPMAELADAIVQSGRSTLEWTIRTIHAHPEWRGEVVYGDTDSVFVHLKGRTKDEAFRIGQEIADFITGKSPPEVVLKFEKVYFPGVLVTKKRYVGYMYETPAQKRAHFEAKGIEVVRRDQCPATVKMQEKVLRILFETRDMSKVKEYLAAEWSKMMQGGDKLLLKDFIFSKEVRYGHYATVSSQPPGAVVACKAVLHDECAVPPYNWRVPYVVVHGVPNAPLKNLVYSPEDIMRRGSELRLNYIYYMTKCINPALDRVLSMCGGDVYQWFRNVSRPKLRMRHINYDNYTAERAGYEGFKGGLRNGAGVGSGIGAGRTVISLLEGNSRGPGTGAGTKSKHKQTSMDQFTQQGSCEICHADALPQRTLCERCSSDPQMALCTIMGRMKLVAAKERTLAKLCQNCAQFPQPSVLYAKGEITGPDCCESLDCQVFFKRARLVTRLEDFQASVSEIEAMAWI